MHKTRKNLAMSCTPGKLSPLKQAVASAMIGLAGLAFTTQTQSASRPNVLLIVADDMGYSDSQPYGGEVSTPTLNSLAQNGVQFTNFHTNASSSPTRSMLLSGVDNHLNGFGTMAGRLRNPPAANQVGKPGYEGFLNNRVVTMANVLQDSGYHTYMSGKWHLGNADGQRPAQRGFEHSYALIPGGDNHYPFSGLANVPPSEEFSQEYRLDDTVVLLPKNYYSTKMYTDRMLEFLAKPRADGNPFFAYLAYTAPHSPLQAPQAYIDKYLTKYQAGWDKLRASRFARQKKLGLIPKSLEMPERWAHIPAWADVPAEQQAIDAKKMAVYAAMIDYMDMSINRIVSYLKKNGLYENTIIIFMSDNGPEANNLMGTPPLSTVMAAAGFDNSLANIGNGSSSVSPAAGFAMVSNSPFYGAKSTVAEGGIRNNLIISYPGYVKAGKATAFTSVLDIFPTVLEYSGATYPTTYNEQTILPLNGKTMRGVLEGTTKAVHTANESIGIEVFGTINKSLYQGDWKILRLGDSVWGDVPGNPGAQPWKLFNLKTDPTEKIDLAVQYPTRFNNMQQLYAKYETRVGFVPAILPPPTSTLRKPESETDDGFSLPQTWKEAMEY